MATCKDIKNRISEISRIVGLEINPQMGEMLADGIEELLVGIVERADGISKENKRKLITADDVFCALLEDRLPFADILLSSQGSNACE